MNCRVLLTALVVFFGTASAGALSVSAAEVEGGASGYIEVTSRTAAPDEHGRYLFLVRFHESSIARYRGGVEGLAPTSPRATGRRKLDVSSPAAVAYRDFLQDRQADYIARINAHTARAVDVRAQMLNVLNAASMWLSLDEARAILSLDFVRGVHIDEVDEQDTDAGPQWIGAPSFWDGDVPSASERRGEGIVIGILDGGFIHGHASFAEEADGGYVHTNPLGTGNFLGDCELVDGVPQHPDAICNDKHIGSFTLHTGATTPEDDTGHGSHVGSIAGGNPVEAELSGLNLDISGVAPRANLINFKVCLDGSCQSGARVQAVDLAIQHGADVINHSIGDSFPWTSPVGLAFLDAHEAGVFVSASAGNTGPGAGSINRGAPWAAIIGNSSHNRGIGHAVDAAGLTDLIGIPGGGPAIVEDVIGDVIDAGVADPDNGEGCDPFDAGVFEDAIALIPRGGCTFTIKVNNATDAGAVGVIVFNHLGGPPIVMGGLDEVATPAVMIDNEDGLAVQAALADGANPDGTIKAGFGIDHKEHWGDVVANLSARGPAGFDVVKPDITAPGTNIVAAHTAGDSGFDMIGGTSMAAPHIAGAAALIMSEFPAWSPAEILSAMALSAQPDDMVKTDGVTPADPFDQGSGRAFLTEAARVGFVMNETVQNFEDANPLEGGDPRTLNIASMMNRECEETCTWERTITSVLPASQAYDVTGVGPAGMTVQVNPDNFTLAPGESISLEITADVSALPEDEWFFGEIIIEAVANDDVAVARMPVVVMNMAAPDPPPPVAVIEVTPGAFEVTLEGGETVTETLTIAETGGDLDLEWETVSDSLTLHDNGPLVTHPGEGPDGSDHSVLQNTTLGMSTLGSNISSQTSGDHFRIADDFEVTGHWEVDTLTFFGYQTGSSTTSTFTDVNFRIWDGVPDEPGSSVVFGDNTTNRLQSTGWTGAYRVSETTEGKTRPIMEVVAEGGFALEPGTYWVDVQMEGSIDSGPWQAPVTITGEDTTGDALQLVADGWQAWIDGNPDANPPTGTHTPQGLPFQIAGTANCWDPAQIDWLELVPSSGTVAAGGSQAVDVIFDTAGLEPGEYELVLCISSNAADSPLVFVPVSLTVAEPGPDWPLVVALRTHPTTPENLNPGDTMSGASPAINDAGQIAARVNVAANSQGHGLWFGAGGSGGVVFELGDDVDSDFMSSSVDVNGLGQAVFERTQTANDNGLWVYDPATDQTTRVTTEPFGTESWATPRMDDDGIIGFRSRFSGANAFHSVDPANNDVKRHAAPVALDPDSDWSFLFTPTYGVDRTITAKVLLVDPSNAQQIRRFAADGSSELIAETTDTDPDAPFSGFDNSVGVNDQGDVAFIAGIAGGGRGVFLATADGVVEIAVQDPAGPVTNIEFFAPDVNNAGQVVFRAFNEDGDRAVFVGDGTELVQVARRGDTVETSMGLAQINRPDNDPIVFGGNPAINNHGTVVFSADLVGADDTSTWFGRALLTATSEGAVLPQPVADISPDAFAFEVMAGDGDQDSLTIANTGEAELSWQIELAESDCASPQAVTWLSTDLDAGDTAPGFNTTVSVMVDGAAVDAGEYQALLCVTTNDPKAALVEVPVTLTVIAPPTFPVAEVTPESFEFDLPWQGSDGDVLTIANNGDAGLNWAFTDQAPVACEWNTDLGNPGGSLNALGLWNGALYAGGSAGGTFNSVTGGVAEVDLDTGTVSALGTTALSDGFVTNFVPFDDGNGERLYILGSFNGVQFDGAELPDSRGLVAWDGSETTTLPGSPFAQPLVFAWDGVQYNGQLVVGGAGGAVDPPQRPVLTFWDGSAWTTFREEFDGLVAPVILAMETFGGDLYFAGRFASIEYPAGNLVESLNIMGFDGEDFFSVGGGLKRSTSPISQVLAMKTFDDGSGEALYIGGRFDASVDDEQPMFAVAKWDGNELSAVGNGFPMPTEVRGFEVYDDGSGPALYAVGNFAADTAGQPIERFAKLQDGEWVEIAGGVGENPGHALALPDGSLGLAGNFNAVGGQPSNGFAQLTCQLEAMCDAIDDIDWLSVDPLSGNVAPGGSTAVDVLVDAVDLAAGEYQANLCIVTDDPDAGLFEIPVYLNVAGPTDNAIFFDRFEAE